MEKEFVTYEIALKLKELGFDEECLGIFSGGKLIIQDEWLYSINSETMSETTNPIAPLWQQAVDWLRHVHNYHIAIYRLNNKWCGEVYDMLRQCYVTSTAYNRILVDTYEEAREQIILKTIELIKI